MSKKRTPVLLKCSRNYQNTNVSAGFSPCVSHVFSYEKHVSHVFSHENTFKRMPVLLKCSRKHQNTNVSAFFFAMCFPRFPTKKHVSLVVVFLPKTRFARFCFCAREFYYNFRKTTFKTLAFRRVFPNVFPTFFPTKNTFPTCFPMTNTFKRTPVLLKCSKNFQNTTVSAGFSQCIS